MILLERHQGDLGMSGWCACAHCLMAPGSLAYAAISAGEPHWYDRRVYQHYHAACGDALVQAGTAYTREALCLT